MISLGTAWAFFGVFEKKHAVVAALVGVQGNTVEVDAGAAGHARNARKKSSLAL
jgi:hypothetical protein